MVTEEELDAWCKDNLELVRQKFENTGTINFQITLVIQRHPVTEEPMDPDTMLIFSEDGHASEELTKIAREWARRLDAAGVMILGTVSFSTGRHVTLVRQFRTGHRSWVAPIHNGTTLGQFVEVPYTDESGLADILPVLN